ncbi:MAG: hypothetical protein ACM357_10380 [Gemmatimonadota bacterium]
MQRAAILLPFLLAACGRDRAAPEITVATIATFGDTTGDGAIAGTPTVARDRAGRYYAAVPFGAAGELVAVYDGSGRFLTRLGQIGDGPGEYRQPNVVTAMGDSMAIFDAGTRRISIVGPTLEWARSFPAPGPVMSAAGFSDGTFVVNWPLPSGDSARGFFQQYDRSGRFVRSYEEPRAPCEAEACLWEGTFVFRADPGGDLWAARMLGRLEISRFDSAGRLVRRLALDAPWFPAHDSRGAFPREMMVGIAPDASGRLWLSGFTTDPEAPDTARASRPGDPLRLDGILEVRDSLTGAVIATRRFDDDVLLLPLGDGLFARLGQSDDGWALVEIWRAELTENGASTP